MNYQKVINILKCGMIVYVPLSLLTPLVMYQLRDNNRMILMDPGTTYMVSKYSTQDQIEKMYQYQVKQAVNVMLLQNSRGFDNPEMLESMFTGAALQTAQAIRNKEAKTFEAYEMHQKPEILSVKILRADRERSFCSVHGQLIRFYMENNSPHTYILGFEMSLELNVNYSTESNARYPFVVTNLKYAQKNLEETKK